MTFSEIIDKVVNWLVTEGVKLVIAIIVLLLSFKVINFISKKIEKKLKVSKKIDETIRHVILSTFKKVSKFLAFICFLGYVGIETSSIAATITSLGIGVGLALKGFLSNIAGGVIILLMHPFKIGDYVEINDIEGTVEEIKMFYTYVFTVDNKEIIIPNGKIVENHIINYSSKKDRRLDLTFYISYNNDIDMVKKAIITSIKNSKKYKDRPSPFINIKEYKDNCIEMILKVWCDNEVYWDLYYYLQEEVKKQFDIYDIKVPYNKIEISINK